MFSSFICHKGSAPKEVKDKVMNLVICISPCFNAFQKLWNYIYNLFLKKNSNKK